jgi:hypothetical protein
MELPGHFSDLTMPLLVGQISIAMQRIRCYFSCRWMLQTMWLTLAFSWIYSFICRTYVRAAGSSAPSVSLRAQLQMLQD